MNFFREARSFLLWHGRGYSLYAPSYVKRLVLRRYGIPGAVWVESGTYRGDTTEFLLSLAPHVYTIEPSPELFSSAEARFLNKSVSVVNGVSETVLPEICRSLFGDINFWLDGHYSAGVTFRGSNDCPVQYELAAISDCLTNFNNVCICIDDVRCFLGDDPNYASYPPLDVLVNWARDNGFSWRIEHDILVLQRFS